MNLDLAIIIIGLGSTVIGVWTFLPQIIIELRKINEREDWRDERASK